ncbi:MAG: HAD family phosphatase [Sandarakinorhabdus sp.]|nr:HAD family phosphatase [Sandarakinorhabdus sp.]
MTRARALLVDLDGTLVDTRDANFAAYSQALAEVGVTLDRGDWDKLAEGRNWSQFLPALLRDSGVPAAAVARRKTIVYPEKLNDTHLNERLARVIRGARKRCLTALVTSASAEGAQAVLSHHGLVSLFDIVVTGSDVDRHKPAPDAYLLAAERLGVGPSDCLIFEDSDIGATAAAAFGAPCRRISFGERRTITPPRPCL